MAPKEKKTPEGVGEKTKGRSPKGKQKATVIRDEPERNLFLECLQSIKQTPTAADPPERRKSTRHSRSTLSPSTRTVSPKGKEECQETLNQQSTKQAARLPRSTPSPSKSTPLGVNRQPGRSERYTIHTALQDGKNVNFEEWQVELAEGHTQHTKYHDWLTERIDDNRRLERDAAAEEQKKDRRLLANSLPGWGNGLFREATSKVVMSGDKQVVTDMTPARAPAEEQQREQMTSTDGPLLSESDRSDVSLGSDAGVDPTNKSFGSDADVEVDYDGTSSEEGNQNPNVQPVPAETINHIIQPEMTSPINQNNQLDKPATINQSIQPVSIETNDQTIQPPPAHEAIKKTINPAGQNENQPMTDKQSTSGIPFNPTGLSPTQWERQKSIFSNVLDGYTSPGGGQVNIQNLMMLAFTQSRQDGESQLNLMAQNHAHISYVAQQQKELLEQQAATIQAGTDKVLAAQNAMILAMETKQKESQKENDSRVKELMARLVEMEMELKREKIMRLEFEAALAIERQNKRRAIDSPENARGGKERSTGLSQQGDHNSTPGLNSLNSAAATQRVCPLTGNILSSSGQVSLNPEMTVQRLCPLTGNSYTVQPTMSASGLPVSRKFNPSLCSSVRSKDRQPSQEIIDAMMAPPPMTSTQLTQPVIQQDQPALPVAQQFQPVIQQVIQQATAVQYASRFNRPTTYTRTIINVEGFHRMEEHINQSVGAWKKAQQDQGSYLPESGTLNEGSCESYLRQLSSALKNHFNLWVSHPSEGVHEDRHGQFKFLQRTFNMPTRYQNPDRWLPNQQKDANHCLKYRCVSIWWYYDQAMRDIPGFQDNSTRLPRSTARTNQQQNQPSWGAPQNQPSWGAPQNQPRQPRYSALQENIAAAAATQRQLALHHYAPEPHEDMEDLDSWDIQYDDLMLPEHRNQVADLLREIKRIKQRHPSKLYTDKRTNIINNAEAARLLDRNSPQIPLFLFNVKTPWSSGYGQANEAYDQDKIYGYEQRIAQLRNTNARLCQMEISSSQHGPTGQGAL